VTDLPTGTVTLLFTDIEGSTQLLHRLGAGYAEVLAEHRRVLRGAIVQEVVPHDGDSADDCRRTEGHYADVSGTRAVVGLDAHCAAGGGRLDWDDGFAEWHVAYVHRNEFVDARERLEQERSSSSPRSRQAASAGPRAAPRMQRSVERPDR